MHLNKERTREKKNRYYGACGDAVNTLCIQRSTHRGTPAWRMQVDEHFQQVLKALENQDAKSLKAVFPSRH